MKDSQSDLSSVFGMKSLGAPFAQGGVSGQTIGLQLTLNKAMEHHAAGHLAKARELYQEILRANPRHPEALHLLGVVAHQAQNSAVAEELIGRALIVKPDYAEAHGNLATILTALGRLDEAVASFERSLAIRPNAPDVLYNMSTTLKVQGRVEEAVAKLRDSLALFPNNPDGHFNLGIMFQELARPEDAVAAFQQAVAVKPDHIEAHILLAVHHWISGAWQESAEHITALSTTVNILKINAGSTYIAPFYNLIKKLLAYKKNNPALYLTDEPLPSLYTVGESHGICPAHTVVSLNGVRHRVESKMIMGCKVWHLAKPGQNKFKAQFERIAEQLPRGSTVVMVIGEIDCRSDEGIMPHHKKTGGDLPASIQGMIKAYVTYVRGVLAMRDITPIFYGVPQPQFPGLGLSYGDEQTLSEIVALFNQSLAAETAAQDVRFLDIHAFARAAEEQRGENIRLDDKHMLPPIFGRLME